MQIKNNYIISIIASFIFLWGLPSTIGLNFDSRFILILILPFILKEIIKDIKKKSYIFFYLSISIFLFLIFHSLLLAEKLNIKFYLSVIFLIYLFSIAYYFHNLFLENKKKISYFFIIIFFTSILIIYHTGYTINPEPISCGAIKNYLPGKDDINSSFYFIHFISSYEFLFQENSHFAMASVPVIIFFIYLIIEKKISINSIIVILIFILISILKMSATLIFGLIVSSIVLIFFEYKRISFLLFSVLLFLSFILFYVFSQDVICLQKINPRFNDVSILDKEKTIQKSFFEKVDKIFASNFIKIDKNKTYKKYKVDDRILDNSHGSTTSMVFFHALNITSESFLKKPFGWGFQRYEDAFFEYNKKNPDILFEEVYKFNAQDGTNNFFKIMTEFGIFGFIIYLILAYSLISKKISTENKFFLFPFLITQSLRGVGYFNAGFILILFIVLVLQFKKKQNVSSLIS